MIEQIEFEHQEYFSEETATFGDRVAAARRAAGLTQEQLAAKLGIKFKTLTNWEEDISEPRANKLQMLAGVMNVSIVWLLTGAGEGVQDPWADDVNNDPDEFEILAEMRAVRGEITSLAQRMARLEKRLAGHLGK